MPAGEVAHAEPRQVADHRIRRNPLPNRVELHPLHVVVVVQICCCAERVEEILLLLFELGQPVAIGRVLRRRAEEHHGRQLPLHAPEAGERLPSSGPIVGGIAGHGLAIGQPGGRQQGRCLVATCGQAQRKTGVEAQGIIPGYHRQLATGGQASQRLIQPEAQLATTLIHRDECCR